MQQQWMLKMLKMQHLYARSKVQQHRKRTLLALKYSHSLAFSPNHCIQVHVVHKEEHFYCTSKLVVEKWDSSKIGGKRGGSMGKQGAAKGYMTARAGTFNTWAAAQDAASSILDEVASMPAAALKRLLSIANGEEPIKLIDTLTAALSKSVAADKGGRKGEKMCSL
jgi:hypothetical protein